MRGRGGSGYYSPGITLALCPRALSCIVAIIKPAGSVCCLVLIPNGKFPVIFWYRDYTAGKVPIFLEGPDPLPELTGSIGVGNTSTGAAGCEFGAEQAVLVRDEATKQKLIEKYGEKMIVLTVHECKGLEFKVRGWESHHAAVQGLFPVSILAMYWPPSAAS